MSSKPAARSLVEVLRAEPWSSRAVNCSDELEHHVVGRRDVGRAVVAPQRIHEVGIEGDATQKLCVGLQSIEAAVHRRDDRGDHLVLAPLERQVGRRGPRRAGLSRGTGCWGPASATA